MKPKEKEIVREEGIQRKEKAHTQLELERLLHKGPCVFGRVAKRWLSQRLIDEDGE
jgi:hypothetical protein